MAKHATGFLKLVDDAKKGIREVTIDDVRPRVERGDSFFLIDVREDREWDAGHLPGATHMGRGIIERDIEQVIPDTGTEIILYCGGGYRSALAAESLMKMGYRNVFSMDGGFRAWRESGLPVVKD